MSSQRNDLDSDALLVMYVNGELANGEKAALERRVASEPALAAELQRVRDAQSFFADSIRDADAGAKMPVGEGVAVRRVSRAIQQWQVDRIRSTPPAQKKGLPLPWWSYPVAVAASLIIGFLVWSSRQKVESIGPTEVAGLNTTGETDGGQSDESSTTAPDITDWMASSFGVNPEAGAAEEASVGPVMLEEPSLSMFPAEETIQ